MIDYRRVIAKIKNSTSCIKKASEKGKFIQEKSYAMPYS